ncbi:beta-ketoacyl-ACP reductase [Desulfobacterota bacterium]|jgi:NAD(P)-dependent dehydrogenase (short-subunit alcohol dehydrogenase family)|nr:beta-ketoacyl-ACP reductase [bacterium]MBT4634020.1 beta-ketoacyl-ACP reductase [bacterium]MDC0897359.1 beta-ketoacyl-ACP reductase [Thermodesulfobacteriota bacterium]MDG2006109.1 beta-ketoacyl-ACP reductase [Thermodesulfobacteriota bacterium]NSX00617.1 beta-ketoacyl-ACP reductase [bacterium]|tara:strand:+ start:146 stop:907 length:762 start_codon:yes stop_codon:yes gene_type:complete
MIEDLYNVKDKVAVVTGSSRGIGKQCALAFAEAGAKLVLNYVSNKQAAEITAEEIVDLGSEAIVVQADVKDFEACQTLGEEAIKAYGQVDFLVNNAGINRDITFSRMSQEEWKDVIDTNLGALFNMSKAVVPHMRDAGSGVIVSISSIIGETGNIGQSNYAATKSGMYGFTRSLARELAKDNIRVNAVSPGFVETDMLHTVPPDLLAGIKEEIPLGRFGYADEIALAVLYLCSPAASWVTGTNMSINGGHNML